MRNVIPDRERWLALGILALVVAVVYLVLVHPWWTQPMVQVGDRIDALQQRDLRARMILSQAPRVAERIQAQQEQAGLRPGFMAEPTPELATAALVQQLEATVVQASPGNRSCAIVNRSPMTDVGNERFPRVVVRARLTCGSPELATVLHALESGSPRLFVANLNVLSQRHFASPGQDGQGVGLDVSFDLIGYLQPLPGVAGEG